MPRALEEGGVAPVKKEESDRAAVIYEVIQDQRPLLPEGLEDRAAQEKRRTVNPVMGNFCHCMCTHAHTCKYSNTAAAGRGGRTRGHSEEVGKETEGDTPKSGSGVVTHQTTGGAGEFWGTCLDKWLHFSPAIANVLTY